jgi:antitoxin YefM
MEVISFNQAKENLEQVLDRVIEDADYTVIYREEVGNVVVMSLDFFNSLMETVHLLKSPAKAHLEKSISQFKQGKVVEHNLLND